MKFSGYYAISVGVLMIAQWAFFLATGQVPELHTEPWRIALHLAAEFITAIGLIVAGYGVLHHTGWGKTAFLLFSGMLCYSVIASPGYFAQAGQWALVAMFAVLFILALVGVSQVSKREAQ
jgi:hypothetical protein